MKGSPATWLWVLGIAVAVWLAFKWQFPDDPLEGTSMLGVVAVAFAVVVTIRWAWRQSRRESAEDGGRS